MAERKRIAVTLGQDTYEKLEIMAERYGITVNAFMAFVLGQYADHNFEAQQMMSGIVNEFLSSPEDVLNNPQLLKMVQEILKDDKEFKQALKGKGDF